MHIFNTRISINTCGIGSEKKRNDQSMTGMVCVWYERVLLLLLMSVRVVGGSLSDHMIETCRVVFYCRWLKTRNVNGNARRINVELRIESAKLNFQEKLNEKLGSIG